ncbi:protein C1orf43 homolog [Daktulosphaira vitifoliae]|uniref:protein C1orf43 homolog n=1 Tax=Daktulosphaira vitifoliae TaxID=58002 RepID=UPI0021AB0A9B|nr:protein C1orf43 homolog [Daktulosphaira vitifoliae]
MAQQLSGVTVVIIIAIGILTFILLFIFAKRQIMRFALRSRRGPHVPIGHDGKKAFKREIERRIEIIPRIAFEPKLITNKQNDHSKYILPPAESNQKSLPGHYYRMKTCDDIKILENEITKLDKILIRHPSENLRSYLLNTLAVLLDGSGQHIVHQFCDLYEHARYDPNDYSNEEYQSFTRLLKKLIDIAKLLKSYSGESHKNSSNKTPTRNNNIRSGNGDTINRLKVT